ncbi:hypothetical protein BC833DRAFT_582937 [Globomyces pollinis-pini]|nr:hypothetical protein BC833DRAFT_582937 [Globomyces pollinis-pini]
MKSLYNLLITIIYQTYLFWLKFNFQIWSWICQQYSYSFIWNHSHHWSKYPIHISFIFNQNTLISLKKNNMIPLKNLLKNLIFGFSSISLYDENGILIENINEIQEFLNVINKDWISYHDLTSNNLILQKSNLKDIKKSNKDIKKMYQQSIHKDGIQAQISAILNSSSEQLHLQDIYKHTLIPNLTFIIGGEDLRFYGYCPWLLATSEFYHIPYLNFDGNVSTREIRKGLVLYANVHQRFGI